jgi:DNA invertase Pin-like site-specific DNA recombinase
MKVGYARVSTLEQILDLQLDALEKHGCSKIFTDKVSGMKAHKPEFEKLMSYMREGDTIVIWKLDRLGRSTKGLLELVEMLSKKALISFRSMIPLIPLRQVGCWCFRSFAP